MVYLPFACVVAPGSSPQVLTGLPLHSVGQSLASVCFPLTTTHDAALELYWRPLVEAQTFYGRVTPGREDLQDALDIFQLEVARAGAAGVCATVVVGVDGTVTVTGQVGEDSKSPVTLINLNPRDDLLTPHNEWQAQALQTNSRAHVDAFRRYVHRHGAQDAVILTHEGSVRPVLGALIVLSKGGFSGASPVTIRPSLVESLAASSALRPRDGRPLNFGVTWTQLKQAEAAWWISPEFEPHPVGRAADMALPGTADFARFFTSPKGSR